MSDAMQSSGSAAPNEAPQDSSGKKGFSRRTFIKVGLVAGAGLTLGVAWRVTRDPGLPDWDSTFAPNAFIRVDEDGSITVMIKHAEMGQGITTSLLQLVAEELGVPVERLSYEFAPAHPAYGLMVTGGSQTISSSFVPLRKAAATARVMLEQAAANRWGVGLGEVSTSGGTVVGPDGSSLAFAELAAEAALLEVPDEEQVPLKPASSFSVIGTSVPRNDILEKSTGRAVFGIDAGPADARVAVIARSPVFGGRLRTFDASAALAMDGVDEVVEVSSGLAVVGRGYWEVTQGREALQLEWDEGDAANLNDAEIFETLRSAALSGGRVVTDEGDAEAALASATETIQADYRLPYLAHATMEPMNCTAWVRDGQCTIWTGTQFPGGLPAVAPGARRVAASAAGVSADNTEVHSVLLGGGFGRRAERDFVHEAAEIAGKVEGPVRLVWSREDDMRHDFYRPASWHRLTGVLGDDGRPVVWEHRSANQSIMQRMVPGFAPGLVANFVGKRDPTSTEGASNQPYAVPNMRMTYAKVDLPVPVGFWRSVGHTHTGFVVESFVDELAHAAGRDPFEYRRELLADKPRELAVLEAVAEAADWGGPVPEGRARGIAVVESFGSFVAEVAEVSVENGTPRVHKVWCAIDCGTVVNPAIVTAQMESGIIFGLGAALYGEINIQNGRVVQGNFGDYPSLRINETPEIEVILAPSGDAPGGVGEPGTPPIVPAVTNAIFALTGQRVRELPIRLS